MQSLKSLTFTAKPKRSFDDPIQRRRTKLIVRLEEQKALLEDPEFVAVEKRWEKNADGVKELVTRKRKVRRWWQEDQTGKFYLTVKYGQKPVEFQKGKTAIAIPNKGAIADVIDVLIAAVQNGELDDALAALSKTLRFRRLAST